MSFTELQSLEFRMHEKSKKHMKLHCTCTHDASDINKISILAVRIFVPVLLWLPTIDYYCGY